MSRGRILLYARVFLAGYMACFSIKVLSQESRTGTPVAIEARTHYGFIVPHHQEMNYFINGHVKAMEINYDRPTFGDKPWHKVFNYPTWGFSLHYLDFANPKVLGSGIAVYPYVKFPILKRPRFRLNYRIGSGFGFISRPFDADDNHKNIAIGSRFNLMGNMMGNAEWKVSDRISVSGGLAFTHFSNGAVRNPNLGINVPSVQMGIAYLLGNAEQAIVSDTGKAITEKNEVIILGAGGVKENHPVGSGLHSAFTFTAQYARIFSHMHKGAISLDVYYNTSLVDKMSRDSIFVSNDLEIIQPGLYFSYQVTVSNFTIIVGQGAYIYTKYKGDGPFYHRIGARYNITKRLIANLTLKTHWAKADYFEWGMGYRIK